MGFWFCCCWAGLWTVISADPYTLSQTRTSFEDAKKACAPGIPVTVTSEQEVQQIRDLLSTQTQEELDFWVGLVKSKNECTISLLPLRGFRWLDGGSQDTAVVRWLEEPVSTCTEVLCAVLRGRRVRSEVELGLVAAGCKDQHLFICKQTGRPPQSEQVTMTTEPGPTTRPAAIKPDPVTPWPGLPTPGPGLPEQRPGLPTPRPGLPEQRPGLPTPGPGLPEQRPGLPTPGPGLPEQRPGLPTPGPSLPEQQPGLPTPGPDTKPDSGSGKAPDSCQHPSTPEIRSVKLDSTNSSRIQVECWSHLELDVFCSGRPGSWLMLDGSPANFSSICQPCDLGFQKDGSGHCVDIDECGVGPCRSRETCLNSAGSYRCVCANHTHNATCDDPGPNQVDLTLTGILVPVLVAVAVLLVLLVLIAVAVKCCLMRGEKKRAREEEEMKTKEAT